MHEDSEIKVLRILKMELLGFLSKDAVQLRNRIVVASRSFS